MDLHTALNVASWLALALFLLAPTADVLRERIRRNNDRN